MYKSLFLLLALVSQLGYASGLTRLNIVLDDQHITLLLDADNHIVGEKNWKKVRILPDESQPAVAVVETQSGKLGYINGQGDWLLGPDLDEAKGFTTNNMARVKKDGRWGFIDRQGHYVIPLKFYWASPFYSGISVVVDQKGNKPYYIKADGSKAFEQSFQEIRQFSDSGLAPVAVGKSVPIFNLSLKGKTQKTDGEGDTKWGYINTAGKMVIKPQYVYAGKFNQFGIAKVERDEGIEFFIDIKGQPINRDTYDYMTGNFSAGGLALVRTKDNSFQGFINTKGEHVFEADPSDFSNEVNGLIRDDYNKFYDTSGKVIIDEYSAWAQPFFDKTVTIALRGGKWGILNRDGRYQAFSEDIVAPYTNSDRSIVGFQDGLVTMINTRGELVYFNRQGEAAYRFVPNKQGKMHLLNAAGATIWQSSKKALRIENFLTSKDFFFDKSDRGEGILTMAEKLLNAAPKPFYIPNPVYDSEDASPYDITEEVKVEAEEAEEPLSQGAIKIVAESYVDEELWGSYDFLYDHQSEIFSEDYQKLVTILSQKYGKPKEKSSGETHWTVNNKRLSLLYLSDTGDGDFYIQLVLTVTQSSGEE